MEHLYKSGSKKWSIFSKSAPKSGDTIYRVAVKIKKSAGALKHRRTFALLFCQSKNQTITESDALHGSQHQQAPEL